MNNRYLARVLQLNYDITFKPLHGVSKMMAKIMARDEMVQEFAWAIPTEAAIQALYAHSPILEIGAGRGYWAALVADYGGEVHCYDSAVEGDLIKCYGTGKLVSTYHPVKPTTGTEEYLNSKDMTLFLCWPPYDNPMAYDALTEYLKCGGKRLVYVGEGNGGCTATDEFFKLLDSKMERKDLIRIPQWEGIHDWMEVYELK